jgi:diguanylate cyclase (GGDEF)-like protein
VKVNDLERPDNASVRVLVAEDDPVSRHRLHMALSSWGYNVISVSDGRAALEHFATNDGPSLAILDWTMPEVDGLEVCRTIRQSSDGNYVYVILLTAHDRDDDVIQGFDAGADDYVTKPFDTRELRARVRSGARIIQLQQQLITAHELLRDKAMHDPLTGLLTRGALFEFCDAEFARARRSGAPLAFVMADIDHFKQINDRYGHLVGDEVLKSVARRLKSTFRKEDAVGRYGGEEFVSLAVGCAVQDAMGLAERFRQAVSREPFETSAGTITVTSSVGVAVGSAADGADALLKSADEALYRAKKAGRNRVVGATGTHKRTA